MPSRPLQKKLTFMPGAFRHQKHSGRIGLNPTSRYASALDMYVQADPASNLGNLSSLTLIELIVQHCIHDSHCPNVECQGKLRATPSRRPSSTHTQDINPNNSLTDVYAEMSTLLRGPIQQSRAVQPLRVFLGGRGTARRLTQKHAAAIRRH